MSESKLVSSDVEAENLSKILESEESLRMNGTVYNRLPNDRAIRLRKVSRIVASMATQRPPEESVDLSRVYGL